MGKRFNAALKEVDQNKTYPAAEAIALAKKTATTKFVGNIEVHIRLGIDPKKSDQALRATVTLPHGTGKTKRIAAFVSSGKEKEALDAGAVVVGGEDLIKKIKETEKLDFDIAIAEPSMMAKLASVAKILGPKGLMPNPKSGTVSADIGKTVKEFATGKAEFKNDESGNIHMILGKSSFPDDQILANFKTFMDAVETAKPAGLKREYIQSISVNATMGPGIKVKI
ncbi:MAG: 50S ribosomal protein L1 [Candidatus Doudnabacteria bacterium RIFCSPLOWO2_02_FULL_49_13]|uniref:Large ribosomal subunit protein uL1 n=1 Tax=Candidatus Doudnabacteria bacterium RIFCSPHIGHO2_12_FULL_48_16 TaxID=1817838 RepID=A0A1F5PL55_9BACT|nr:MAG: 50S ribosomal protein L1 [Candidatus Doudnabacteria bacterium RIFCSPHIGHO2_02_FULL_49_24]OGE88118.1 MAG: 50S ribosomal protein L1 [Candidatus Doudnabacteria bacterium RIFCSPHIGHO2_01_FULL_50_67]OGE90599.1 MAG: 50S ribosomal protein L1 [Candidatus Doudnabacteria bacterium RIFCSPHIGHO2_12_FULL_48_16]OGE96477.1 MAG: 50S ribosomal protein L1 [Candidatus Doudnabacteria bacterium RIFCSPLOWO2_01_FULL_49_40]OGF02992.1 MAG: 50S ribosomal protein L1 [Candidatus Doudnabacteria bacterium RIFCSPLOWO